MLENYDYINLPCVECDIAERIKLLFLSNSQQKRYEHILSVTERIDKIAIQYGLDREKCRIAALLHDISTLIKWEDMLIYAKDNNWSLCEHASKYQMALFIADKMEYSLGGQPSYYESMKDALTISMERACYEYVKYLQEGNMRSIHSDFAKATDWLEEVI